MFSNIKEEPSQRSSHTSTQSNDIHDSLLQLDSKHNPLKEELISPSSMGHPGKIEIISKKLNKVDSRFEPNSTPFLQDDSKLAGEEPKMGLFKLLAQSIKQAQE